MVAGAVALAQRIRRRDVDRSDCLELMTYILDRYANMRGTFLFVTLREMLVETMQSSGPRSRQPDQM